MDRREFLSTGALAGAGAAAFGEAGCAESGRAPAAGAAGGATGGAAAYRHSVCHWPFAKLTVDQLAAAAKGVGVASVELLEPDQWAVVRARGLACAVGYAPAGDPKTRLTVGWNRRDNHAWLVPGYERGLALAGAAGVPNVICFSGNRGGLSDEEGLAACADGLRRLMPAAERARVTVVMELLNSKVDHKDYQCDRTPWGVELVRRVGSERFKLLYDIYHMQIMEGDVIRTIRDHGRHIGHYHVAGNPGRHEPDASQELNYPAVMRAIAQTGFSGYVAQEFIPTGEPLAALAEAVRTCQV
jgi:hydroxypyruvate isomerase